MRPLARYVCGGYICKEYLPYTPDACFWIMRGQLAFMNQPFVKDKDGNPIQHYWEGGTIKVSQSNGLLNDKTSQRKSHSQLCFSFAIWIRSSTPALLVPQGPFASTMSCSSVHRPTRCVNASFHSPPDDRALPADRDAVWWIGLQTMELGSRRGQECVRYLRTCSQCGEEPIGREVIKD